MNMFWFGQALLAVMYIAVMLVPPPKGKPIESPSNPKKNE